MTVFVIILANLVPAIGVVFFGWSTGSVVMLFWFESLVVGFFNIFKMLFAQGDTQVEINGKPATKAEAKGCLIPFFMLHYGIFVLVQGIFMLTFVRNDLRDIVSKSFFLGMTGVFCSHLLTFIFKYIGEKQYKTTDIGNLMITPYWRIMLQQFIAIGGSWLEVTYLHAGYLFVVLIIFCKTIADLAGHYLENRSKNRL
jgi:hypothetical protein